jgi:serine/threonine protein phosphatase PrpC
MLTLYNNDYSHSFCSIHDSDSVKIPLNKNGIKNVMQPEVALQVVARQDPGIKRKNKPNEDTLLITEGVMPASSPSTPPIPFALLLVADGMGGQGYGRDASRLAAQSLIQYVFCSLCSQHRPQEMLLPLLRSGVQYANEVVYERNQRRQTSMGTTMTVALVIGGTAFVGHVGDSRLYLYHAPTGLAPMTHDHSIVAELVAAGIISADDIYTHPRRNQIYRSLGGQKVVEVDTFSVPLTAGDILLLCSDGLWEMVRDQQIMDILTVPRSTPLTMAHALILAALAGGGQDNVSVIVAQVSEK